MRRTLTAHNAQIQTAAVSIRTLTVEGKQVTMGVFRQLIEEDIISWNAPPSLNGVGWGHVRYLIDCQPDEGINLVWQKGSELRRCIVYRSAAKWRCTYESAYIEWTSQTVGSNWHEAKKELHTGRVRTFHTNVFENIDNFDADEHDIQFEHDKQKDYDTVSTNIHKEQISEKRRIHEAKLNNTLRMYRNKINTACTQYEALVGPLFDLPHLFIAV